MSAPIKLSNKAKVTHVMVVVRDGDATAHVPMPLEEFARLFEWGEEHGYNRDGRTVENVIRARESDERGNDG